MYFLDPARGRRRRALLRDKGVRAVSETRWAMGKTSQDLANRAQGLMSAGKSLMHMREDTPADILIARVRSKIGRVVDHPSAISVIAEDGCVILRGPVLKHEHKRLVSAVSSVRGVREVIDELEVYKQAEDVPGLQGGHGARGERWEILQTNWAPAIRFLVGTAGTTLLMYGLRERGLAGTAAGVAGAGMLARALSNREMKRILGIGAGRAAVNIQKTLNIYAPPKEVFSFWSNYQNFPRFMTHLREVRDLGNGRSHWIAAGPAGVPVAWDAEITEIVPNEVLAWKSTPGSTIENAGIVRFDPNQDGGTRVTVRMSYNPPAGAMGHAVASLFGADPKRELDDDLLRLKSLIETGKTRAHGHTVLREEVAPGG
jgi:uncharacterized membrane protein